MPVKTNISSSGTGAVDLTPITDMLGTQLTPTTPVRKPIHSAYYYPGWKDQPNHPWGPPWDHSWWWKDSYPERQPLQGWYDEGQQIVMDRAIKMAVQGGVDNFVFNYYHDGSTDLPAGDHAIKNFISSKETGMTFAIGFETQTAPKPVITKKNMDTIIDRWGEIVTDPRYLRINGKPAIWMIKMEDVQDNVLPVMRVKVTDTTDRAMTHAEFLAYIKKRIGMDLYFVACGQALSFWVGTASAAGYDCYSAYNLFFQWTNHDNGTPGPQPASYAEMAANHIPEWQWFITHLAMDFMVPMTVGFDSRPWSPGVNIGIGTPTELRAHFLAAKTALESSIKCVGTCVYAWNEWGEGGWIEPCLALGREKLGIFKSVFKA